MSPTDRMKKLLEEADLNGAEKSGAERVLESLHRKPATLNRAEPPAGYEQELLAALSRKLPLEKKTEKARPAPASAESGFLGFSFFRSASAAWSLTAVFAGLAVVTLFNFRPGFDPSSNDLLAQTARRGGAEVVGDWMASMGDTTLQKRVAMADINAAAKSLGSVKDRRLVESVLTDVARRMGMK